MKLPVTTLADERRCVELARDANLAPLDLDGIPFAPTTEAATPARSAIEILARGRHTTAMDGGVHRSAREHACRMWKQLLLVALAVSTASPATG